VLLVMTACSGGPQAQRLTPTPTRSRTHAATVTVGEVASTLYDRSNVAIGRGYFSQLNLTVRLQPIRAGQTWSTCSRATRWTPWSTDFGAEVFNGLGRGAKYGWSARWRHAGRRHDAAGAGGREEADGCRSGEDAGDLKGRGIVIEGGTGSGNGYLASLVLNRAGVSLKDMTVGDVALASMERPCGRAASTRRSPRPVLHTMERDGVKRRSGRRRRHHVERRAVQPRLGASAGQRFFRRWCGGRAT